MDGYIPKITALPLPKILETETAWVDLFRILGGKAKFPEPEASQEELNAWIQDVGIVPGLIILLGIIISMVLFICLCCCRREREDARGRPMKPSSKPVLILAILTAAVIVISYIGCWDKAGSSYNTAKEQLDDAAVDLNSANTQATSLYTLGKSILTQLNLLKTQCPAPVYAQIQTQIAPAEKELEDFLPTIQGFGGNVSGLNAQLKTLQSDFDENSPLLALLLATPMLFVSGACAIVVSALMLTRGCGGASFARCNDCCLIRLGGIFISLSVLIAGLVAGGEAALGTAGGSLCTDVDYNILGWAQSVFPGNSTLYQATSYYISDVGANPLSKTLDDASLSLSDANGQFKQLNATYGPVIKQQCNGWSAEPVLADMTTINGSMAVARSLVSRKNIYPYYKNVMHDDMCSTVIAGLGWLVSCQLVVGLLFLPALSVMSGTFFSRWAAFKEAEFQGLLQAGSQVEAYQHS